MGRVNLHEYYTSTPLVGMLDLWHVCLGLGGGQDADSIMSGAAVFTLTLHLSDLAKCMGNVNSGAHLLPSCTSNVQV